MELTPLETELLEALRIFVRYAFPPRDTWSKAELAIKHAEEKQAEPDPPTVLRLSHFFSPCCKARAYVLSMSENKEEQVHLCLQCLSGPYNVTVKDNVVTVPLGYTDSAEFTPCCNLPANELSSSTIGDKVERYVACPSCDRRFRVICKAEDAPASKPSAAVRVQ